MSETQILIGLTYIIFPFSMVSIISQFRPIPRSYLTEGWLLFLLFWPVTFSAVIILLFLYLLVYIVDWCWKYVGKPIESIFSVLFRIEKEGEDHE